jgi:hypothetical protein
VRLTDEQLRAAGFRFDVERCEYVKGGPGVQDRDTRKVAELERSVRTRTLDEIQVQKGTGGSFLVRVTSYRHRFLDDDNLCEKYHVDLCRYAGILPGDSPATTRITVSQEKVGGKEPERVLIEVFKL